MTFSDDHQLVLDLIEDIPDFPKPGVVFKDITPMLAHAETLALHQDRIDAWVGGQGGNRLVIDARFDASTGISVERGDSSARDVFSVRLVLERSNRLEDIGYRIVTGYPTAP